MPIVPDGERVRILAAAHEEIVRWGIDRFSVPALAHRHGLDYQCILREWGDDPTPLILEVLTRWPGDQVEAPDSGDLQADLYLLALAIAGFVTSDVSSSLRTGDLVGSPSLPGVAIRRQAWRARAFIVQVVLDRAHERGELRHGIDALTAGELLFAPINMRVLLTGEPVDDEYCRRVAELVWHAVAIG